MPYLCAEERANLVPCAAPPAALADSGFIVRDGSSKMKRCNKGMESFGAVISAADHLR
jgi:hypothetical protein